MNDRTAKIIELKNSGKSYSQIAEVMGLSKQRVQQLLMDKSKKRELLEASDGTCDLCGRHSDKLDAHHEDYTNGPEMLLCTSCHISLHNGKNRQTAIDSGYEHRTTRAPEARMTPTDLSELKALLTDRGITYGDWIVEKLRDELRQRATN